jgi:hypothetical protein
MGKVVPFDDPYDFVRAMRRIKSLVQNGDFVPHPHLTKRMLERGIDIFDIQNVIRTGRITEISQPRTAWRYRIEGKTIEGDKAACVIEMDKPLLILTAFWLKGMEV